MAESNKMKVWVKYLNEDLILETKSEGKVKELKRKISEKLKVPRDWLLLIAEGKQVQDKDKISQFANSLHLLVKPSVDTDEVYKKVLNRLGDTLQGDMGVEHLCKMQQRLQSLVTEDPDLLFKYMNTPLTKSLMSNPELIGEMVRSNEQTSQFVQCMPDLWETLNNPKFLRRTREAAKDPAFMKPFLETESDIVEVPNSPTVPEATPMLFGEFQNSVLQNAINNPQNLQTMFNSPLMKDPNHSLLNNAEYWNLVMEANPLLKSNPNFREQVQSMLPQFTNQMQNADMQSLITQPGAMEGILQIKHGLQNLQQATPDLFPSLKVAQAPTLMQYDDVIENTNYSSVGSTLGGSFYEVLASTVNNLAEKDAPSPEKRYKFELAELEEMGFTGKEKNLEVLIATFGNMAETVERLDDGFVAEIDEESDEESVVEVPEEPTVVEEEELDGDAVAEAVEKMISETEEKLDSELSELSPEKVPSEEKLDEEALAETVEAMDEEPSAEPVEKVQEKLDEEAPAKTVEAMDEEAIAEEVQEKLDDSIVELSD